MGTATYTLGGAPTISVNRCHGDLTIEGQAGDTATVASGALPHSAQDGALLVIESCDDDLRLSVPLGAAVTVGRVDGDARAERLAGFQLDDVGGDLDLAMIAGPCTVRNVDGDLHGADLGGFSAHTVDGDARLERIGGAIHLERVDGDIALTDVAEVTLGTVGGDLRVDRARGRLALEQVDGDLNVRGAVGSLGPLRVSGDLALDTSFVPGGQYRAAVYGDAVVHVPENADLTLEATVHGNVTGLTGQEEGNQVRALWGNGSAVLSLTVYGDLQVCRAPAAAPSGAASAQAAAETGAPPDAPVDKAGQGQQDDPMLAVLEAVARGDISPAEADDLLSTR